MKGDKRLPGCLLAWVLTACGAAAEAAASAMLPALAAPPAVSIDVSTVVSHDTPSGLSPRWFTKGAFIEIYVRAFHDSDGDGVGDLKGVVQKLDYLRDLGVTGIWLMPINKTDDHDSGYIVTDYRDVETEYGTVDDVKTLVKEAHARGIGVIMDYVVNHSSIANPLFVNSASSKTSAYRDWYVWQDSKPTGWRTWSGNDPWYATPNGAYYGVFWDKMPDFNLRNPAVIAYHKNSMRFWLNLGIDGFRFDAVQTLIENDKYAYVDQPESMALMRELRTVLNEYSNRYLVCENPGHPGDSASEMGCKSAFAFDLNQSLRDTAKGTGFSLERVANYPLYKPIARSATLLASHDRYAGLRLMDEFSNDETHYRLAAATLLTYPGIPFIYYGEEVGMNIMPSGHFPAGSDWPQRGPMSWDIKPSVTDNAKSGDFAGLHLFEPAPNIATHNVALQSADPASLWRFYRTLLNLRKNNPALQSGNYALVKAGMSILVFERRLNTQRVLVAINYGSAAEPLALTGLCAQASYASVLAYQASAPGLPTTADGAANLTLPAQSVQVFALTVSDEAPYRAPLYVRGTMNDWAATPANRLSYSGNNRFEVTLALTEAKTYLFKIGDRAWALHQFGGVTPAEATTKLLNVTSGAGVELEPVGWKDAGAGHEIQIDVAQPGNYRFVLDSSEPLAPRLAVERK